MSGNEFMERFSWHVEDKGFRMVRYYGFLSPLKCIMCGNQMRFTGLKRGYQLAELVQMYEPLARMRCAADSRIGEVSFVLRETE